MARQICDLCGVVCIWCNWWKCKCWYKANQAKQSNDLFALKPEWLKDSNILQTVVKEIKSWHANDVIIKSISEWTPLEKIVYPKSGSIYCEYPVWSWGKWMWVECLKCSKPRFEWLGKLCEWRKEETKEEDLIPNE